MIELEPHRDERGWFARTYCQQEFEKHGIKFAIVQSNLSLSVRAGTLRGMHFQKEPHAESKLIRCVRGSIHDVVIDLRPDSPTYRRHFALGLSGAWSARLCSNTGSVEVTATSRSTRSLMRALASALPGFIASKVGVP